MFSLRTKCKKILHALAAMLEFFIAAVVMTQAGTLEAQTVNWVPSGPPSARCCMGMAYDPATKLIVLFGGANNDKQYLADTWVWQGGWFPKGPATSPSARVNLGMAFDGTNIVLFGGNNDSGASLGDTWTWDGTNWSQQFPSTSPSARDAMMTYDAATGDALLFGGSNSTGALGDTWTWDGATQTWTQQNPATSPSPRSAPMAYDAATGSVVLFGGNNGSTQYTDTWLWNGTNWTQVFPAVSPSTRQGANMAYDPSIGAVVLFGGFNGVWEDSLNDTWIWNGTTWKQIQPATVPPNRYGFGIDYDAAAKILVMFGGYSSGPARGHTWLLALEP